MNNYNDDLKALYQQFKNTSKRLKFLQAAFSATEPPYSIDFFLDYKPPKQGFTPASFWDSMKWQRGDTSEEFINDKGVQEMEQIYIRFCQNFNKLPLQNYQSPPHQFSIPPIIHFIWLGSPLSPKINAILESWRTYHPGWEIKIWTDSEIADFPWSSPRIKLAFEKAETWAEKSDIWRLEVLYTFGGIYSDTDVICLNSFHDLIVQDVGFFGCFEWNYKRKGHKGPFVVGSAIMGARKNSHVIQYSLECLQTALDAPDLSIIHRTGPGLITFACQAELENKKETILILPCSYLYPISCEKRVLIREYPTECISSESLAIHLWNLSWRFHRNNY